jgi:hypothetical protein
VSGVGCLPVHRLVSLQVVLDVGELPVALRQVLVAWLGVELQTVGRRGGEDGEAGV